MVSTQGSAPRIHGFPKGPSRRPGHQTRQLQDRRCHTSNRAIDNYNFYPFLKVKDTDILLIFIWKFVGIQGYLWQLVCTNKYRIVRYVFFHGTQIMVRGTDLVIVAAAPGSEVSDSLV